MGRRGPLPKRPGRAVGHGPRPEVVHLVPMPERQVPRAPDGLLASTRKDWRAFWESPKAQLVTPENRPALERLFRMARRRFLDNQAGAGIAQIGRSDFVVPA